MLSREVRRQLVELNSAGALRGVTAVVYPRCREPLSERAGALRGVTAVVHPRCRGSLSSGGQKSGGDFFYMALYIRLLGFLGRDLL